MKIGILTFHRAHNYGAVLQAYALQEFLREQDYDAEIIDYNPTYFKKLYCPSLLTNLKGVKFKILIRKIYNQIITGRKLKTRYQKFEGFINNYLKTTPFEGDFSDFDYIIIGSDQVWSPSLTGGMFDKVFFGEGFKCKILSYAASSNKLFFTENEKRFLKENLERINPITVREDIFRESLRAIIDKDIFCVLDPTFIAGEEILEKIVESDNDKYDHDYILSFELSQNKSVRERSKEIGRLLKVPVIFIAGFPYPSRVFNSFTDLSPQKLLSLIKNAKCIVTNSFHGVAFSLIFNKSFYCIKNNTDSDSRFGILDKFDLQERILEDDEELTFKEIDYNLVNDILTREIEMSKDLLIKSLK